MSESDKVNILLVDDQPARLLTYELILADLGQNLVRARSGLEALEKLMKDEFAVVLLDISMPGMDGFETASLIHEHPRFETTPIIFVTGVHISELDRLKGYKLGAVDYVSIPVVPEILRGKVAVLVELYCKRRELQSLNRSLEEANDQLAQANTTLQAEKNRELEALNRTLQEGNRHKDEFLAMLAHELRNPLAPILNAVQLLRQEPLSKEQLAWSRDLIERQLRYLSRLVDDLLDVSRITRGKINLAREPVVLSTVVTRALETMHPLLNERNQELHVRIEDESLRVFGDLTRLTQAVGNLLSNAVKYTDPGGRIALQVRRNGTAVEISVSDTGIGIPEELLPTVFELFTQLDRTENRAQGGLGIGLALVRKLVELHGGSVSARSDGNGRGSEFVIRLPCLEETHAEVQGPAHAPSAQQTAPASRRRILVADDNRDALESLSMLLQLSGHEVYTAADGAAAVEVAVQQRPEVALLDIGMPKMNGYDVARRIRAQPWGGEVTLIALTGWGQDSDRRRSRDAGFDAHLVKPLDLDVLLDVLAKVTSGEARRSTALAG